MYQRRFLSYRGRWLLLLLPAIFAALFGSQPAAPARAAFPGANGQIAFTSTRDGNEEIYLMNADGSGQTRLTTNLATDRAPAWSPDGMKIAFTSTRDGNEEIYVMNADGSGQTRLTTNTDSDLAPAWSPDGTRIAFTSTRDGNFEIYVMGADGAGPTNLTNNAANDLNPSWSPDGTKIAFISRRDGNAEIYVMDADGTGQSNLTNDPDGDFFPDWSPNGTRIAFYSNRDGNGEVYVMDADGSAQTNLTNNAATDEFPGWSPDGTQITFSSFRDGNSEIYAMNDDGSAQTRLTTNAATDVDPDWQPLATVFVSTTAAGSIGALDFGPDDILKWDGSAWSLWFDGSAAGLTPNGKAKHNINAFYLEPDSPFTLISFTQNARTVPGIFGKVDGMDLVVWDGSQFILVFDGQDVGLTNKTSEKIDGLHLLPGDQAPPELLAAAGGYCQVYLLISTQGPGKVPNYSGGTLNFSGEDILGFCVTSNGDNTAGKWIRVLDGSAQGMPKNSTGDFSLSDDGQTLYLTTKGTFNVDSAAGGHSMVYRYNMSTGEFSGPYFSAPAEGLLQKVDGLQVEGMLP